MDCQSLPIPKVSNSDALEWLLARLDGRQRGGVVWLLNRIPARHRDDAVQTGCVASLERKSVLSAVRVFARVEENWEKRFISASQLYTDEDGGPGDIPEDAQPASGLRVRRRKKPRQAGPKQ
jgi:hypothetical protein